MVDKRNQKSIQRILESAKESDPPAYLKAQAFYQSCLNETEEMELINKRDMLAIMEDAGGCQMTGKYDSSLSFDWRMQKLQNQLGELNLTELWNVQKCWMTFSIFRCGRVFHLGSYRKRRS